MAKMVQAEGFTAATRAQFQRMLTVSRVETTLLLLVIVDMAVKPGLG